MVAFDWSRLGTVLVRLDSVSDPSRRVDAGTDTHPGAGTDWLRLKSLLHPLAAGHFSG